MQKITDFSYTILFKKKKKKLQYINKPKHNENMICIKILNYKYKWKLCVYVIVKKKNVVKNMLQLLSLINYMNLKYMWLWVFMCVFLVTKFQYLTNRPVTFTYMILLIIYINFMLKKSINLDCLYVLLLLSMHTYIGIYCNT